MRKSSRNMALCGVLCALAVVLMSMGTLVPGATYAAPLLASLTLIPALILCGEKLSWVMFFAAANLSLLLAPDKEAAMIFLALGYYPLVKPRLDKKPKLLRIALKAALFHGAIFAVYAVLLFVLQAPEVWQEAMELNLSLGLCLLVGGNLVFWLDDALLSRLSLRVARKLQKYR